MEQPGSIVPPVPHSWPGLPVPPHTAPSLFPCVVLIPSGPSGQQRLRVNFSLDPYDMAFPTPQRREKGKAFWVDSLPSLHPFGVFHWCPFFVLLSDWVVRFIWHQVESLRQATSCHIHERQSVNDHLCCCCCWSLARRTPAGLQYCLMRVCGRSWFSSVLPLSSAALAHLYSCSI